MKKIYFLMLLTLALNFTHLQAQNHFIYIQSETTKPFIVSVDNKQFNSTATGYVIIPKLKSGEYNLSIKFKDVKVPETWFSTVIDKQDVGFTLKDLGKNTASLVDLQTYAAVPGIPNDTYVKNQKASEIKGADKSIAGNKNPSTDKISKSNTKTTGSIKPEVLVIAPKLKKGINKISQIQNDNSMALMFVDVAGNVSDTIDVIIPIQKEEAFYKTNDQSLFQWATFTNDEQYENGYNSKCVHLLTTQDVHRLRKKMSAENTAGKMIQEALKVSKSKCFTTADVKKLSVLFLKEQGKVQFFEAMYNHVYDYIEYPRLEDELAISVNKEKFKSIFSNKAF